MRVICPLLVCAALALSTPLPARAQPLTLLLERPLATGVVAPASVSFTGTLTNAGATPLFLNAASITSSLNVDDTPFLLNAPASLAPGATVSVELFRALVAGGTTPGGYGGTLFVLGGANGADRTLLASASFEVRVGGGATSTVPEPGTSLLLAGGLAAMAAARARRRRTRRDA